jgi:hypothetical protein
MSVFADHLAGLDETVAGTFGDPITVAPMTASDDPNARARPDPTRPAMQVTAVVTSENVETDAPGRDPFEAGRRGSNERLFAEVALAALPYRVEVGDQVTHAGATYRVAGRDPNGPTAVILTLMRSKR